MRWYTKLVTATPIVALLASASPVMANDVPILDIQDDAVATATFDYYANQSDVDSNSGNVATPSTDDLFDLEGLSAQQIKDQAFQYYNGRGVDQNKPRAIIYYERAAELGNAQAQRDLAYLEARGEYNPEKDYLASYENDRPRTLAELQQEQTENSRLASSTDAPQDAYVAAAVVNTNYPLPALDSLAVNEQANTTDTNSDELAVIDTTDAQSTDTTTYSYTTNEGWAAEWLNWYKENCNADSVCAYKNDFIAFTGVNPDAQDADAQLAQFLSPQDTTPLLVGNIPADQVAGAAPVVAQTCDASVVYANNDEWAADWLTYFKENCNNNPANSQYADTFIQHTGIDPTADDAELQLAQFLNKELPVIAVMEQSDLQIANPVDIAAIDIELPSLVLPEETNVTYICTAAAQDAFNIRGLTSRAYACRDESGELIRDDSAIQIATGDTVIMWDARTNYAESFKTPEDYPSLAVYFDEVTQPMFSDSRVRYAQAQQTESDNAVIASANDNDGVQPETTIIASSAVSVGGQTYGLMPR